MTSLKARLAEIRGETTAEEGRTALASVEFPKGWNVPGGARRRSELKMWMKWKNGGETQEDMEPLLDSLQPLINKAVTKYSRGTPIRREAVRGQALNLAIEALRRYDPSKSQLNTHLTTNLKGLNRYVIQHQNMQRVTESRSRLIGPYQRAYATLEDRLDRQPTAQELSEYMTIPIKQVTLLQQEYKRDELSSMNPDPDVFLDEAPIDRLRLRLLYYELTQDEKLVYEYLTGYGGKPKVTRPGDIARSLGWSSSKVSQVKKSIAQKLKRYTSG